MPLKSPNLGLFKPLPDAERLVLEDELGHGGQQDSPDEAEEGRRLLQHAGKTRASARSWRSRPVPRRRRELSVADS